MGEQRCPSFAVETLLSRNVHLNERDARNAHEMLSEIPRVAPRSPTALPPGGG